MNHLKRQASEELLPTRASKVQISEDSFLNWTWTIVKRFVANNAVAFVEAATENIGEPLSPITPGRRSISTRSKIPSQFRDQSNRSLPPPPRRKPPTRVMAPAPTIPALPDQPTTSVPSLASGEFGVSEPELSAQLAAEAHRRSQKQRLKNGTLPKQYESRDHILVKSHKARVQEELQKDKEEMINSLYELKKQSGYKSDKKTFKNFLLYKQFLERSSIKGALSPSSSVGDLRARATSDRPRRHSSTDNAPEFLEEFLVNALRKARESLNGPPPVKDVAPRLQKLYASKKAEDEAIERRLRPKRTPLPPQLPPADEAAVDALISKRGVVAKFGREQVVDKDIGRLRPCQWLNDEIINYYGQMILARSEGSKENPGPTNGVNGHVNGKAAPSRYLNVHYFNTFFWTKLKSEGYEKGRLAKWTKKMDIFEKDVILIPVNHDNSHWTAAAINFRQKRIESYDSMDLDRSLVYKLLRGYLDAEHRNKKKKPFDFTGWEDRLYEDTPQQENGYDCGVFTCQFLESLSRGEEAFNFSQSNMPYIRRRMIWEIGNGKLRDEA